jgi:hypothetical protein
MRGRRIGNMDLGVAGVLAAAYGMRLIASSAAAALLVGHPPWLDYTRAALEYLVPIPGAMLFERFFAAGRFRRINRIITAAFIALAAVAIPYEIGRRQPGAANGIVNAVVLVFMSVYVLNLFAPARDRSADWRLLRIGTAIFGAFVINAHFQFVRDPYGLSSEPVGFLIFIAIPSGRRCAWPRWTASLPPRAASR